MFALWNVQAMKANAITIKIRWRRVSCGSGCLVGSEIVQLQLVTVVSDETKARSLVGLILLLTPVFMVIRLKNDYYAWSFSEGLGPWAIWHLVCWESLNMQVDKKDESEALTTGWVPIFGFSSD